MCIISDNYFYGKFDVRSKDFIYSYCPCSEAVGEGRKLISKDWYPSSFSTFNIHTGIGLTAHSERTLITLPLFCQGPKARLSRQAFSHALHMKTGVVFPIC